MILNMTEGEREFRELFWKLHKKYRLNMHLQESVYENKDDSIEIWREDGEKVEIVCRTKEKDIEDCYRRAVADLQHYDKRQEEKRRKKEEEYGRNAADHH